MVHVLVLVSAVVCVLSLMLVGRLLFRAEAVYIPIGNSSTLVIGTLYGELVLQHVPVGIHMHHQANSAAAVRPLLTWEELNLTGIRWLKIGWRAAPGPILILPLWLLPILTAILPVRWWLLRRRSGGGRGFPVEVKAEA